MNFQTGIRGKFTQKGNVVPLGRKSSSIPQFEQEMTPIPMIHLGALECWSSGVLEMDSPLGEHDPALRLSIIPTILENST